MPFESVRLQSSEKLREYGDQSKRRNLEVMPESNKWLKLGEGS
jgi:hypothetical protein